MATSANEPCRLFVIPARNAPRALIFRRGPSKWTQLILWHTQTDTFEDGAWFNGRIYSERCDISPDGTKLIYFAADYRKPAAYDFAGNKATAFPETWTAISKVPWLTALCVWPNSGTYFGGGLFPDDREIWINQDNCRGLGFVQQRTLPLPADWKIDYTHSFYDHDWHQLFRLERDGWKPVVPYATGSVPVYRLHSDGSRTVEASDPDCPLVNPLRAVHEKSAAHGAQTLVMTSQYFYTGFAADEKREANSRKFEWRDNQDKSVTAIEGATWADWDHRGRLVFARNGRIFTARSDGRGGLLEKELADFNDAKPRRTKAPDWARHW